MVVFSLALVLIFSHPWHLWQGPRIKPGSEDLALTVPNIFQIA